MNLNQMWAGLAPIGLAVLCQSAVAGTINVSYAGSANFGLGGVGYYSGSVVPNPNSSISFAGANIGGDSFTSSNRDYDFSVTGQFNTWCVDITHWMSTGSVSYNVGSGGDLAAVLGYGGGLRVNQLVRLANEVYSTVDTKLESAAFQLAVWAITFGASDAAGRYHVNASNSGFRVDGGTANSLYGLQAKYVAG